MKKILLLVLSVLMLTCLTLTSVETVVSPAPENGNKRKNKINLLSAVDAVFQNNNDYRKLNKSNNLFLNATVFKNHSNGRLLTSHQVEVASIV